MAARLTGTVTFLFTDIEGSTQLWEHTPEAMRSALARHDDILRESSAAAGGYVYKTIGDAFQAAFATAPQALAAALAAQRALPPQAPPVPTLLCYYDLIAPHKKRTPMSQSEGEDLLSTLHQLTSFVGGAAECAQRLSMLRDPACRLVSIIGPGGMDKTRLAIEAARPHASPLNTGSGR